MDRARTGSECAGSGLRYRPCDHPCSGTVIGIDITPGMLREAGNKTLDEGCAKIEWIEHDVTPLKEAVQSVARQKGGLDVISCCSAFVLLMSSDDDHELGKLAKELAK
jgi:ubiquinone/menaquinone biosynthesis C-methylase UbiE